MGVIWVLFLMLTFEVESNCVETGVFVFNFVLFIELFVDEELFVVV